MEARVYRILRVEEWELAKSSGAFTGSGPDLVHGFIHLSAARQLPETLRLYYSGQDNLLVLGIDAQTLGDRLKWEISRGDELFPHLYGELSCDDVDSVAAINRDAQGQHVIEWDHILDFNSVSGRSETPAETGNAGCLFRQEPESTD